MTRSIAILLPPSEGKAAGGAGPPWTPGSLTLPGLDQARLQVLAAFGPDAAEAPTMAAGDRYTGVLYRELAYRSLPAAHRRRLDRTAVIVSGLWGVVAPTDPIPGYRLKMNASLPSLGRLSTWWRPHLTDALAERLRGRVVWDLLPGEHAAAWRPGDIPMARRITVRFVDGNGRTVSHWNKLLKGAVVRHLLAGGRIDGPAGGSLDPSVLASFEHPTGYRFDPDASDLDGDPAVVVVRHLR